MADLTKLTTEQLETLFRSAIKSVRSSVAPMPLFDEIMRRLYVYEAIKNETTQNANITQKAYEEAADVIVKMDIFIGELPYMIRAMKIPEPGPRGQETHAIRWNQAVERSAIEIERLTEEFAKNR